MSEIKGVVKDEVISEIEELSKMTLGTDEYDKTVKGIKELAKVHNDILIQEAEVKKQEAAAEVERQKVEDEREDRKVKNMLTKISVIGGFVLTTLGTYATFRFDEKGTITSTLGRQIVNKFIPKK